MAILPIPVWTISPDWADPVTEGLEWLTGVMASSTGVEQRQSLRLSPRRYFEFTVRPSGQWRTYCDALLSTVSQVQFYLPLWHEVSFLRSDVTPMTSTLVVAGDRAELKTANVLFIKGPKPYLYELAEVTSVSVVAGDMHFVLTADLENSWPKSTLIYPVVPALLNTQPQANRLSDSVVELPVRFDVNQANDWAGTVDLPTYLDYPVIAFETNESDTQTGSYFRLNTTMDTTIGLQVRRDVAGVPFSGYTSTNFSVGRDRLDDFRSLLYRLQGRLTAFWLVYPTADFELRKSVASTDTTITVSRSGFTDLGGPGTGRQDIQITLRNGSALRARVSASAIGSNPDTEVLTLSSALGSSVKISDVVRISFMAVGRLDQDLIELSHITDADGVMSVAVVTKAVSDSRDASDWTPAPPVTDDPGDCGSLGENRIYFRRNGGPWNGSPSANPSSGIGGISLDAFTGPFYPVLGFNTGFFGGEETVANFGASGYIYPLPLWGQAWDESGVSKWDSDHSASGIVLSDDKLTAYPEGEISGAYVRATKETSTQYGLRYFELQMNGKPQNWFAGICDGDFSVSGGTGGHKVLVRDDGSIQIDSAEPGITIGTINVGDVVSVLVYTEFE